MKRKSTPIADMDVYPALCKQIGKYERHFAEAGLNFDDAKLAMNELEKLKENQKKYEALLAESREPNALSGRCGTQAEAADAIKKQRQEITSRKQQIALLGKHLTEIEGSMVEEQNQEMLIRLERFFTDDKSGPSGGQSSDKGLHTQKLREALSGMNVKTSKDVDFIELQCGTTGSTVQVQLHYTKQKPPHPTKLCDVKVIGCCVALEDLISRAIANNDFCAAIPDLQLRLKQNSALADEIESLRKTSAIDWVPDDGCLKLMVGVCTCTLKVPHRYPASGSVRLIDVKGVPEQEPDDLQPLVKNPTLSDWVNHLDLRLDN